MANYYTSKRSNSLTNFDLEVVLNCLYITLYHYPQCVYLFETSTYSNFCRVYSVGCVCKIESTGSVIFYAIYGTGCSQLALFFFDDFVKIYHFQIGNVNHYLGLVHDTMVCAVCLVMLLLTTHAWPTQRFSRSAVDVKAWMRNYIPQKTIYIIAYSFPNLNRWGYRSLMVTMKDMDEIHL